MAGIDQSWVTDTWLANAVRAAQVLIPYVPDRRATSKTDLVEIISAIEAAYEACPFITGGPFKGARGLPLRVFEKSDDPNKKVEKPVGVLSVVLTEEELDLVTDGDGNSILRQTIGQYDGWLIVPHSAATWSTSALGFQKHMLVLDGKVKAKQLEHDDAEEIFEDLVWLGKADKDEMFAAKIAWLALVGIRAANDPTKFGPSLLTPIQDQSKQIKPGWHMDPVIEYMLRVRDEGIRSSNAEDSDEIFKIKDKMRVFLYGIADRFYVLRELQPKWREGRLDHRDVSKAVDNHVWKFASDRRAKIVEWRERADKCIRYQLEKKADRLDLGRSDIDRALASDLLYQWLPPEERKKAEARIYLWADSMVVDSADFQSRTLYSFGIGDAKKAIAAGYGNSWAKDRLEVCGKLLETAWRNESASACLEYLKRWVFTGRVEFEEDQAVKELVKLYSSGKIAPSDADWLADLVPGVSVELKNVRYDGDSRIYEMVADRFLGEAGARTPLTSEAGDLGEILWHVKEASSRLREFSREEQND